MSARVLPHSLDAEASILGGVLLRNDVLAQLDALEVDDFYDHKHKVVFQAIRNLESKACPIDVVTLEDEIAKAGKLDAIGGVAFLGELTLRVPTADNVAAYAEIVVDKHQARRVMLAASEILEEGYDEDLDVADYLSRAEAAVCEVAQRRGRAADAQAVGELARRRYREIDDLVARRQGGAAALTGIPTGINELDRLLGGWQKGIVNLLAARPAMGKSATAIATVDAATAAGHGALMFTLEDSWRAYADRVIARGSGVPATRIRQGEVMRQDYAPIAQAVSALGKRENWRVDDRADLSVRDVARSARRWRGKMPDLALVVVDYVQLLLHRAPRQTDHEALDEIMGGLARLAKELDVAVVALSQLNRKLEERTDRRPQLSDLRGSGGLEEKAKIAVGCYRGSEYGGEPQREIDFDCTCAPGVPKAACPHRPDDEQWARTVQYVVMKNNNGPTGRVFASWSGPTMEVR